MSPVAIDCRPTLSDVTADALRAGDAVEISGTLLTIRDASARRLAELHRDGRVLPIQLSGALLYASGPSPAKPGQVIGSAGPTTTDRFTPYLRDLFAAGAKGIIGKGELHGPIVGVFAEHRAVYFAAIGGLGALLAKHITSSRVVAFHELGPEAIYRFEVVDFPAVVIIDVTATNFHDSARSRWRTRRQVD